MNGLLDSIPAIGHEDGNFIMRGEGFPVIKRFIEDNRSSFRTWRVIPYEDKAEKIRLNSAYLLFNTPAVYEIIHIGRSI